MWVGDQHQAAASLPPGKTRYPLCWRLGGSQERSGRIRKISPPTGILSPDGPARSESLYRLSYPGPQLTVNMLINFHSAEEDSWLILGSQCCTGAEFSLSSSDYPLFLNYEYVSTAYFFHTFQEIRLTEGKTI
jgi:hypothetical protein